MIFVDTGGWYSLFVPADPNHKTAKQWLESNRDTLITTDYVVDETLTLLRARGKREKALEVGSRFFDGTLGVVYRLSEDDLFAGWHVFHDFSDKDWSFTDCTSKVVIDRLEIKTALAFDKHFEQFGNVRVIR